MYTKIFSYCSVALLLLSNACQKERHPVPNVPVDLMVNLDLPSYQGLNAPGGYVYLNGGSRGILLYRNIDRFAAMDRHSTYNSDDSCSVVAVNPNNSFELIDSCNDVAYSISTGVVIRGAARWGLRTYNTSWNGGHTVHVYN